MAKGKNGKVSAGGGVAGDRLKSFVERIERLQGEKKDLAADIAEVKGEAKGAGFDMKALNETLRRRRLDKAARAELDALVETYERALGDFGNTELGKAAHPAGAETRPHP